MVPLADKPTDHRGRRSAPVTAVTVRPGSDTTAVTNAECPRRDKQQQVLRSPKGSPCAALLFY
jgi:hypothetical protein